MVQRVIVRVQVRPACWCSFLGEPSGPCDQCLDTSLASSKTSPWQSEPANRGMRLVALSWPAQTLGANVEAVPRLDLVINRSEDYYDVLAIKIQMERITRI